MSETEKAAEAPSTLVCFICRNPKAKDVYSKSQLKAKGKRRCNECVGTVVPEAGAAPTEGKVEKVIEKFNSTEGATVVKQVLADDIKKAQERGGKTSELIPGQDKYDVLLQWLRDGGSKFSQLELKYYTVDYRGVHAKSRMEKDQIILEVPLPLIMTSDLAKTCAIGLRIRSSGCQLRSSHSWLACMLLQEKYDPNSFFRPYIDTLPQHYRNMPIFFDDDELHELKGSFSLKMISDRKISLKQEYDNIVQHVPEFRKYHLHEFMWARLAVITRIFGFEVNNQKTDGLVAMADMLNHKRPNETSWHFDGSLNAFTITTTKRLLKGAQVFDSYGRKCNSRFFVNYGFTLDQNEDNQAVMIFSLPRPGPDATEADLMAFQAKARLIGAHPRRSQIPFEHKERVSKKCTSFLRVCFATDAELGPLLKHATIDKIDPINATNEAKVMQAIADQAEAMLRTWSTTLEEDNKILEGKTDFKLTMNMRNCVIMRRGEKEVLNAYIDLNRTIQEVKDMDLRNLRKYLSKNVNNRGTMPSFEWRKEQYFEELWIPMLTGVKKELEDMDNSLEDS